MKILITGGAGFIGTAIAKKLMKRGDSVVLIDNFNDYYDPQLKHDRINIFLDGYKNAQELSENGKFTLYQADIRDVQKIDEIFTSEKPDKVIHLAAMAGVRSSLEDPLLYMDVNVLGTTNMLNAAVKHDVENFVYASSSSVYGKNTKVPFSETDSVDMPVSPYAASKKANELIAHTYSHVHGLKTTGLRFFTVYGPWGRPDMGVFKFPDLIIRNKTIDIYNHGDMERNFTYIDDIASGTIVVLDADLDCGVMNIGGDRTVRLMDFVEETERAVGKTAEKNMLPMQPGDVQSTVADITKIRKLGWAPTTRIAEGIPAFVKWYRTYYKKG